MKKAFIISIALLIVPFTGCQSDVFIRDPVLVPPTVDEDPQLPAFEICVGGITRKLHYREFGKPGSPLLLVAPGSISDVRCYFNFETLSDKYRVILFDSRGCGLSERVSKEELSLEMMVEEYHQVKDYFSPNTPVSFVGHSWSATFAAVYAGTYPEDLKQLILMEPTGLHSDFMSGLNSVLNLTSVGYSDMSWFQYTLLPTDQNRLDFSILAMLKSGVRDFFFEDENPPEWPVWRVGGLALLTWEAMVLNETGMWEFDYTGNLENFATKVLIIGASHSPLGYLFQEQYNRSCFPDAEVYRIEECGHRIVTEKWDELETGLKSYLIEYTGEKI